MGLVMAVGILVAKSNPIRNGIGIAGKQVTSDVDNL
ncbi:hypothetical protein SVI_3214 [Shewanella violacea DSS12]|uniref:Uncharacterized protein n=1 Tax=Shewanella violacea (strain JCM 10179 / CIP 106290 / LMG 19151 / DSS12) TaxID=637905 RepID=D4ZAZ0_SHEVD|nr:hypothetical protein SVI_3214 [Shewanella violacea DSS12]